MANYISVPEHDFSHGIDARSAENIISPGFVADAINADVIENRLRKRKGYQGFAGNIPVRVSNVEYQDSNNAIVLTLGSAIDISMLRSSPLVIYGRTSSAITSGGPFTNAADAVKYYAGFTTSLLKTLLATSGLPEETITITAAESGISTTNMYIQVAESTSSSDRSYAMADVSSITNNESTNLLTLSYQNSTAANILAYTYYWDRTTTAGSTYTLTMNHTGSGSETFTVAAGTHGLFPYQFGIQLQEDLGASRQLIEADSVQLSNTGTVSITLVSSVAKTFYAILTTCATANYVAASVAGSSTGTITLSNLTSPWVFPTIWRELTAGGTKELVGSDAVTYDDSTQDLTINFTNPTGSSVNYIVYYDYGTIRSNQLTLSDSTISVDVSDTRPQLTVWGLDHADLYTSHTSREGWVTHIDSYRRSGEDRIICGLGGNLFAAQTYDEANSTYNYAKLYPNLRGTLSASTIIAPLLYDTGETPARTRGYITGTSQGSNFGLVTSAVYDSGTGYTKYVLSIPSKLILDSTGTPTTLSAVISTTSGLEDWLTLQEMPNSLHEGTFKIKQILDGTNQITLYVENASITNSDWDDTGCIGLGGVFTDQVTLTASSSFIPDDIVINSTIDAANLTLTCMSSSSSTLVVNGITSVVGLGLGIVIFGQRTSKVLPLKGSLSSPSASVTNLVAGDMLSYTGISRLLRIKYINPDSNRTVNLSTTSGICTGTLTSGTTMYLTPGNSIVLTGAGVYTGVHEVLTVPTSTTFTFSTSETATVSSATLLGYTIEIDEELQWNDTEADTVSVRVENRFIPIEAPDDSYGLTPSTYIYHLASNSYTAQPYLRSTMVSSNSYFTNNADEVLKYDGTNITRAGLIPWQAGFALAIDTTSTAKIVVNNYTIATGSVAAFSVDTFKVTGGTEAGFRVGDRVQWSRDSVVYNLDVIAVWNDNDTSTPHGYIQVNRISGIPTSLGSVNTLTKLGVRKYYYRCNLIDSNNNIIASAVTGSDDHVVELAQDAAVKHKIIGFPVWGIYDYDRIEVEIYGTPTTASNPYYRLTTLQANFNNSLGYLSYTDTYSDSDLLGLDIVSTALLGQELGIGWSDPLRAKYITTIGNRLVLGNITDYPQFDIQFIAPANTTASTYAGKILTFRLDGTDSGSTTSMPSRARYEFINGTTGNTTAYTIGTNQFTVTCTGISGAVAGDWIYLTYSTANQVQATISAVDSGTETLTVGASHGLIDGDAVQLTGSLPTGLSTGTTYYVVGRTATTIQLSATLGGSPVNLTSTTTGGVIAKQVDLTLSGWYQIASIASSDVTINLTGVAAATCYPNKYVVATDPTDIPVLLGTDGNLGMFNGDSLDTFDLTRRLSMAINASMRMTDTSVSGMTNFYPWLTARSGNDVANSGQIIIRQTRVLSTTSEVECPSSLSGYSLFINGVRRAASDQVSSVTRVYPSRILVSYPNYPEIFDSPTSILDIDSDSAIDVNSADGQEITGVIPFFGESAFGASLQAAILTVFKQNSIYLINLDEKVSGRNPVQRIETEGLGCTAPYSIASTRNGLIFANESGIYCLRRNLTIQYLGKYMERKWIGRVNTDQLGLAQGHHYGVGRRYKLSLPIGTDVANSEVYVYDHTQESESNQYGAWTRYDNHPATGWANLLADAYMASTAGRVYSIRRANDETDYRDDSEGVAYSVTTRGNPMGDAGIRKALDRMVIHYRNTVRNVGTTVLTSTDLREEFVDTTSPILARPVAVTGHDDTIPQSVQSLVHETSRRKGVYFQVQIANSTIDEDLDLAGIDYRVAGLDTRGIVTAQQSRSR